MSEPATVAAFVTLLTGAGLTVYKGAVPDNSPPAATQPYVALFHTYEHPEEGRGNAVDGASRTAVARFYCHCVGGNTDAAVVIATKVRTAVLDVRPVITGRVCGLIRQEQALPPAKDETTGQVVMDAIAVYKLRTEPA